MALVVLIFADLAFLPIAMFIVSAGPIVEPGHHGASGSSIAIVVVLGAALLGLTFAVGRAWHRAPRPGAPTESN